MGYRNQQYRTKTGALRACERKILFSLEDVAPKLREDPEVVEAIIKSAKTQPYVSHYMRLELASPLALDDTRVGLAAVQLNGRNLQYLSDRLRADKSIIDAALKQTPYAVQYVSPKLMADRDFVEGLIRAGNETAFKHASEDLRNDKDMALLAVSKKHFAYAYIGDSLKQDKDVAIAALQSGYYRDGNFSSPGGWIAKELMADPEIAHYAIETDTFNFTYLPEAMQHDKEMALKTVELYGHALRLMPDEFKADKDVVMAAVKQRPSDGRIVGEADSALRADKDFMMQVIQVSPNSFKQATKELRADKEFAVEACKLSNGAMYLYIDESLYQDVDVAVAAIQNSDYHLPTFTPEVRSVIEAARNAVENEFLRVDVNYTETHRNAVANELLRQGFHERKFTIDELQDAIEDAVVRLGFDDEITSFDYGDTVGMSVEPDFSNVEEELSNGKTLDDLIAAAGEPTVGEPCKNAKEQDAR